MNNFHVQHAEEATAKTEAESVGVLWFVIERRIIQREFGQRIPEAFEVIRRHRKQSGVYLRLDAAKTCQRLHIWCLGQRQGVANRRTLDILDTSHYKSHFARAE